MIRYAGAPSRTTSRSSLSRMADERSSASPSVTDDTKGAQPPSIRHRASPVLAGSHPPVRRRGAQLPVSRERSMVGPLWLSGMNTVETNGTVHEIATGTRAGARPFSGDSRFSLKLSVSRNGPSHADEGPRARG